MGYKSLRLEVVFLTFGGCKSLCSGVVNPYVQVLYFLLLGVKILTFRSSIYYVLGL